MCEIDRERPHPFVLAILVAALGWASTKGFYGIGASIMLVTWVLRAFHLELQWGKRRRAVAADQLTRPPMGPWGEREHAIQTLMREASELASSNPVLALERIREARQLLSIQIEECRNGDEEFAASEEQIRAAAAAPSEPAPPSGNKDHV